MNPGNASFILYTALIGHDRWLIRISGPAKNVEAAILIQTIAQCFINS